MSGCKSIHCTICERNKWFFRFVLRSWFFFSASFIRHFWSCRSVFYSCQLFARCDIFWFYYGWYVINMCYTREITLALITLIVMAAYVSLCSSASFYFLFVFLFVFSSFWPFDHVWGPNIIPLKKSKHRKRCSLREGCQTPLEFELSSSAIKTSEKKNNNFRVKLMEMKRFLFT